MEGVPECKGLPGAQSYGELGRGYLLSLIFLPVKPENGGSVDGGVKLKPSSQRPPEWEERKAACLHASRQASSLGPSFQDSGPN